MSRTSPSAGIRAALLSGKRRPRTAGGSPTMRRGDGYEFVELRAYVAGDDVRRIDWPASARAQELQTRVILEDVALTLAGVLDDTPSMQVGRRRPLARAGAEALAAWYAVAAADDRCVRVIGDAIHPRGAARGRASAAAALGASGRFDMMRSLNVARVALRPGAALLVASDCFDLSQDADALLLRLARRCDCTLLLARDPWYEGLPLSGLVRMRGAEGGTERAYIGGAERARYTEAVRVREEALLKRFASCGWRAGVLREEDGAASLAAAFGL